MFWVLYILQVCELLRTPIDGAVEAYLMKKLEGLKSESEDPHYYTKHVATIVGLQPHSELWVLNGQ